MKAFSILICEDVFDDAESLRCVFESKYDVMIATSVEEAEVALRNSRENPDLRFAAVIIDLRFGNERRAGLKILKMATKDKCCEVIVYTGAGTQGMAYEVLARGAFMYLPKAGARDVKAVVTGNPGALKTESIADAVRLAVKSHAALVGLTHCCDELIEKELTQSEVRAYAAEALNHIWRIRGRSDE